MRKIFLFAAVIIGITAAFYAAKSTDKMQQATQKVNVWDTYVTKKDGQIMHFDILAPVEIKDTESIYNYGKDYLKSKGEEGQALTAKQCRLCHIETLRPAWEKDIAQKGYFVIEMEGCE